MWGVLGGHEGHHHMSIPINADGSSSFVAYLLVLALSFHSIFEGVYIYIFILYTYLN